MIDVLLLFQMRKLQKHQIMEISQAMIQMMSYNIYQYRIKLCVINERLLAHLIDLTINSHTEGVVFFKNNNLVYKRLFLIIFQWLIMWFVYLLGHIICRYISVCFHIIPIMRPTFPGHIKYLLMMTPKNVTYYLRIWYVIQLYTLTATKKKKT